MSDHKHIHGFGDSASVAAPSQQGEARMFVYVASCACGAIEVSTQDRVLAVIPASEAQSLAERV